MRGKGWSRTGWPRGRERGCRVKEHPWGPRGVASRWVSTEACAGCCGLCSKKGSEMNGFDIFFLYLFLCSTCFGVQSELVSHLGSLL